MAQNHLLNLLALADESLDDFELLGFEGREAISEPFEYRLDLITVIKPDLTKWIGKLAEFDVTPHKGARRVFAGRIYAARRVEAGGPRRVQVLIRPAYYALSYAHGLHFAQDKTSLDIFDAMTGDVLGLVKKVSVTPTPPKRGYAVRLDEPEIDFLARLLAQDGIMYFFEYDRGAGTFRHKMIVTNKPSDYIDLPSGAAEFLPSSDGSSIKSLERQYSAAPTKRSHLSLNVNKLDTPFKKSGTAGETWAAVYSHDDETIGCEALAEGDVATLQQADDQHVAQAADFIEGTSSEATFMAGGRVEIVGGDPINATRVVLTAVHHSAIDPWMLQGAGTASYSNTFTALDADKAFRPEVWDPEPRTAGPILGVVGLDSAVEGEAKVDDQFRIPVLVTNARDYSDKGLPKSVWLPVQQQWAHGTHGAQFMPRVGSRVIIDFLYGNPDLPFVSGTVYNPSQKYPFTPNSDATKSGWRSVTDKNGGITQEFYFWDKPDSEEIKLYTGRDYRREIDNDDWGKVKRDQTLEVDRDQKLTVTRDRTVKIDGKQKTDITQTRTVTVTDKSQLESKKEIEMIVGPCSIKMTMQGIEIKAPKITIKADIQLDMSGGATAALKAPKTDVNGDGMLTLKGGIVMIN